LLFARVVQVIYVIIFVVVWFCWSLSAKWSVGKTGFLHQSSDWVGRSSPKWPV